MPPSAIVSSTFFADLLEGEDVALRVTRGPVERAERAAVDADVRVVDVPVDLVRDAPGRVEPAPHGVRRALRARGASPRGRGRGRRPTRVAPPPRARARTARTRRRSARAGGAPRSGARVHGGHRGHQSSRLGTSGTPANGGRSGEGMQAARAGAAVELREPLLVLGLEVVVQVAVEVLAQRVRESPVGAAAAARSRRGASWRIRATRGRARAEPPAGRPRRRTRKAGP